MQVGYIIYSSYVDIVKQVLWHMLLKEALHLKCWRLLEWKDRWRDAGMIQWKNNSVK